MIMTLYRTGTVLRGVRSAWVELGVDGQVIARVITTTERCPMLVLDCKEVPTEVRMAAGTMPLRPTRSAPEDSKPSVFPVTTREFYLPVVARSRMVKKRNCGRNAQLSPSGVASLPIIRSDSEGPQDLALRIGGRNGGAYAVDAHSGLLTGSVDQELLLRIERCPSAAPASAMAHS